MALFFNKSKNDRTHKRFEADENVDLILIREKYNEYTQQFFAACGVNITYYFTNLEEAEFQVLSGDNKARVIIVEEGLGDYTTISARKSINGILGLCDEDDKLPILIYSSSIMVTENKSMKFVEFEKFVNTQKVLEIVQSLGENYNPPENMPTLTFEQRVANALNYIGASADIDFIINQNWDNKVLTEVCDPNRYKNPELQLESFNVSF